MSRTTHTLACVLRTVKYADNHLIVTFLGRDTGKFSAIAHGARASRKRFGGALLPLRVVEATLSVNPNRDLATLKSAEVERDFRDIEADFDKITIASYATELLRSVTREGDESPSAFDLLTDFYGRLADADINIVVLEAILHHFELSLLDLHGARPELRACHRCGLSFEEFDKLRCSRRGEGLVCANCLLGKNPYGVLAPETLQVLHYLEAPGGTAPDAVGEPAFMAQARRVVESSLDELLDSTLKSRAMLETILIHPDNE